MIIKGENEGRVGGIGREGQFYMTWIGIMSLGVVGTDIYGVVKPLPTATHYCKPTVKP